MAIIRPYRRVCRQFSDGSYYSSGKSRYILHPDFAKSPEHYVRAFLLVQKDLLELFDYIEPADANLSCHSFRTHELLLRACVEVEANCKAILAENGYTKSGDLNMTDYKKLNRTHRLSSYEVRIPTWYGNSAVRKPFAAWAVPPLQPLPSLPWYDAYNQTKHNRHDAFALATFENMLDSVCGLLVVLSAQFFTHDFTSSESYLITSGPNDGTEQAIGGYFRIKFPADWPDHEKYDFDWMVLEKTEPHPFQLIVF